MWQPMIQQRIRLPPTVVCHHTPQAVQRVYMRHQHDSSSCLSNGQKICLFLLTCHFETRWDSLTYVSVYILMDLHIFESWLITCVSCISSGYSPWRSVEWDVPPVCHPVVPTYGQLSSSDASRSFPHTTIQNGPAHSWPAHPGRGF